MKCISVIQPWATFLVMGKKQYETRGWATEYRGPMAIHASRKFDYESKLLCDTEPFKSILKELGIRKENLPLGALVGRVDLVEIVPTKMIRLPTDPALASGRYEDGTFKSISEVERALGDYKPNRKAWRVANPTVLKVPIQMRGSLGLFDVADQLFMELVA